MNIFSLSVESSNNAIGVHKINTVLCKKKKTLESKKIFSSDYVIKSMENSSHLSNLMTSLSDYVIDFSNFEFCNSITLSVFKGIKCLSFMTVKLLLFTF